MMMSHILRRKSLFTASASRCFSSFPPLLQQVSGFSSSPNHRRDANFSSAASPDLDAGNNVPPTTGTTPFLTAVEIEKAFLENKIPGPRPIATAPASGSLSILPRGPDKEYEDDSDSDSDYDSDEPASNSDVHSETAVTPDRLVLKSVTYLVEFNETEIETVLTNRASIVDKWIDQVSSTLAPGSVIGFGCDMGPTLMMQFCVDNKCLIYHMRHKDISPMLIRDFVTKFTFVGVGIKRFMGAHGLVDFNYVDVAKLAKAKWPEKYDSLPELHCLAKDLGIKKSVDVKRPCLWKSDELTTTQIENACLDAFVSYKLGKELV